MSHEKTWNGPVSALTAWILLAGGIASTAATAAPLEQYATSRILDNPVNWIDPNNVLGAPDDNCTQSNSSVQSWIELGFDPFLFPVGDVVTGIEVSVKHSRVLATPVRLTINGILTGDTKNLAADASALPCAGTAPSPAGGAGDLWGLDASTLKTELESGHVGFRLTSTQGVAESYPELFIDSVKLIVHHAPLNSPPTASCQDVTVSANASCQAVVTAAQVDNGSSDPDSDPLSFSLSPAGPYPLGDTPVILTVSDGNASDTCSATITVEDNTAPVISLTDGDLTLECGVDTFTEPGYSATDNCDDPVSVTVGGDTVDEGTPGSYVITYNASDNAGNDASEVTRAVTVQDTIAPVITLNGDNPMTLECGVDSYYPDPGATVTDACGISSDVVIGGDAVDLDTPDTYQVTYDATDDAGNAAIQVVREVTVEDTLPPEIACSTPVPATIIPPDAPISFTATAVDVCEGPVTAVVDAYDCYWANPSGKLVDKTNSCVVSFTGDTLTIEDSGGVKDTIEWSVTAADSVPNQSSETCSVEVVSPAGKKP